MQYKKYIPKQISKLLKLSTTFLSYICPTLLEKVFK